MLNDPEYIEWLRTVPAEITEDTLWRMTAYRYAMFVLTKSQDDVALIIRCRETRTFADQLLDAVGGISANLEDGYSRYGSRERAHFFEYALSCAREARGWYPMRARISTRSPCGTASTADADHPDSHQGRSGRAGVCQTVAGIAQATASST